MEAGSEGKIARGVWVARGQASLAGQARRRPRQEQCEDAPCVGAGTIGRPHGCVSTRATVVEAMLDMCGYTPDKDLSRIRLLDPAAGSGGAFTVAAMRRLAMSSSAFGFDLGDALAYCITAVEVDVERSRSLAARMSACLGPGWTGGRADGHPVVCGDFLESDLGRFDIVVGNPPYVRHELIPSERRASYREAFRTFRGRSDLYVAFFEKALDSLSYAGRLCIVCPDRWMRNAYGAALRARLSSRHRVRAVVRIDGLDAFEERVQCYPAIVVVDGEKRRQAGGGAMQCPSRADRIACHTARTNGELAAAAAEIRSERPPRGGGSARMAEVPAGKGAWLIDADVQAAEEGHLAAAGIEERGFRIGIGVATGADSIFTGFGLEDVVESDLLVPMVASGDINARGQVTWAGRHLVNPYRPDGTLADLAEYPMAQRYLEAHKGILERRYVVRNGGGVVQNNRQGAPRGGHCAKTPPARPAGKPQHSYGRRPVLPAQQPVLHRRAHGHRPKSSRRRDDVKLFCPPTAQNQRVHAGRTAAVASPRAAQGPHPRHAPRRCRIEETPSKAVRPQGRGGNRRHAQDGSATWTGSQASKIEAAPPDFACTRLDTHGVNCPIAPFRAKRYPPPHASIMMRQWHQCARIQRCVVRLDGTHPGRRQHHRRQGFSSDAGRSRHGIGRRRPRHLHKSHVHTPQGGRHEACRLRQYGRGVA